MLKHILILIKNQHRHNVWVFVELLLVFVLLWYSVDNLLMQGITALQPEGFSLEHVYKVSFAVRPKTSPSYIQYEEGAKRRGQHASPAGTVEGASRRRDGYFCCQLYVALYLCQQQ
ncbi:MAG: hypothetical protein LUD46_04905 [Parabacteroides sp.]|nr:hypothetical protein [Parabacteroides sp.]